MPISQENSIIVTETTKISVFIIIDFFRIKWGVMIHQDLILCLQKIAFRLVLKEPYTAKQPSECFLNPPCGCSNPGKALQCEECPYLEACLSQFKTFKGLDSHIKDRVTVNTRN
jgi:hypothetical protein